jgi:hypothetical protein
MSRTSRHFSGTCWGNDGSGPCIRARRASPSDFRSLRVILRRVEMQAEVGNRAERYPLHLERSKTAT